LNCWLRTTNCWQAWWCDEWQNDWSRPKDCTL